MRKIETLANANVLESFQFYKQCCGSGYALIWLSWFRIRIGQADPDPRSSVFFTSGFGMGKIRIWDKRPESYFRELSNNKHPGAATIVLGRRIRI